MNNANANANSTAHPVTDISSIGNGEERCPPTKKRRIDAEEVPEELRPTAKFGVGKKALFSEVDNATKATFRDLVKINFCYWLNNGWVYSFKPQSFDRISLTVPEDLSKKLAYQPGDDIIYLGKGERGTLNVSSVRLNPAVDGEAEYRVGLSANELKAMFAVARGTSDAGVN
jgi:hypothetical protein